MQDFWAEGVHQMFGGFDFRSSERNFTLVKALKFWRIFQKYVLKLIAIRKIIEKIREKCKIFRIYNFLW